MLLRTNNRTDNEFVIVWFDPQPVDELKRTIRLHAVQRHLHTFTDQRRCLTYLDTYTSNTSCKIFFITSGSAGSRFIPDIYGRPSIVAVYICCAQPVLHLEWTQTYAKIRGIFIDKSQLIDKLIADIGAYLFSLTPVGMAPSFSDENCHSSKSLASEHFRFMWMRLFGVLLGRLASDQSLPLKNNLTSICKSYYEQDEFELKRIDDFEKTYEPSKVIWWYTRDSFLYRLMNRAFRAEDTNVLFHFRSIITDLHNQIVLLYKIQYAKSSERFTVYRGQGMSAEELQKIIDNRGGFLSFNTFLSTTLSSNIASDYAGDALCRLIHERSVLFQINIDLTISSIQPFANISEHSCMQTEDEILFSIGAIFRIDDVSELTTGGLWIAELSLTDAYDPNLDKLFVYYRQELNETPTYAVLSNLLRRGSNNVDKAELYCAQLFNNPSTDKGLVYYQFGLLYENEDKDLAELYYNSAVTSFIESHNRNGLVQVYATQGEFYRDQQRFTKALACNHKARQVEKQISIDERLQSLPNLHTNLAKIYSEMGKHCLALKYFRKAVRTNKKRELPINHPVYAGAYISIGDEYARMHRWRHALGYYRKAFAIQELYLKKDHSDLAQTLIAAAKMLVHLSDSDDAISTYQRAILILSNSDQRDEGELIDTHRRLGRIYESKRDFEKALDHYHTALALPARRAITVYMDIAHACEHNGATHLTIQVCHRGLREFQKLVQTSELLNDEIDAIIFLKDTLGRLYQQQKKYRRALIHFHDKLDIEQIWLPYDQDRLGVTYHRLAFCHFQAGHHHSALKYFCRLFQCASHLMGGPEKMFGMLVRICIDQQYYSVALQALHKQLLFTTEHLEHAHIYARMAFVYQKMGCYQLVRKLYGYSLPILASLTQFDGEIDFDSIEHNFVQNTDESKEASSVTSRHSENDLTQAVKKLHLAENIKKDG